MEIKNAKRWAPAGAEPYYMAILGFILAFAVRYTLIPVVDDHLPMLFFAINCVIIAYLYGFWPSFFVLTISIPTALFFFVKPYNKFDGIVETDLFIMIVYITLTVLTALMFELLHRSHYKAELLVRVSESRYRLLVEADEDRRKILESPSN